MTIGYIYRPLDKTGSFAGGHPGQVIANPNRDPPWIVVNHTLDDVIVATWPGRLWRAEVLDALEPQEHWGNYTRCIEIKLIEELKTEVLFGEFGACVEIVLRYASVLKFPMVRNLARFWSIEMKRIVSDGWHRWLSKTSGHDRVRVDDLSDVTAIYDGLSKSPIGEGFSLIHRCVWDSAKQEVGMSAFEEDDEEIWLKNPWADASNVLMAAAWAFGARDLFDHVEIEILLEGWKQREIP